MLFFKGTSFMYKTNKVSDLVYTLFVINIKLTNIAVRSLFNIGRCVGVLQKRVWFVCHNFFFSGLVVRYAIVSGSGYSVYDWIGGCLTNMSRVFSFFFALYVDWLRGFKLLQRHKVFIFRILGFGLGGLVKPMLVLIPRVFESTQASYEVGNAVVPSSGLIDSNMLSNDMRLPIPGNDDSLCCVNFVSYFFAKYIITFRVLKLRKVFNVIKVRRWRRNLMWFVYSYFVYFPLVWESITRKYFEWFKLRFDILFQYKFDDRVSAMEPYNNYVNFVGGLVPGWSWN